MLEEADQHVKLWLQLGHEAYSDRQMLRALHYFQRALDYAQEVMKSTEHLPIAIGLMR